MVEMGRRRKMVRWVRFRRWGEMYGYVKSTIKS